MSLFLVNAFATEEKVDGAQIYLDARKLYLGRGCLINEQQGKDLYLQAVNLGEPRALAWKARRLFQGSLGFSKDEALARKLFQEVEPLLREMVLIGEPDAKGSIYRSLGVLEPSTRGEEAFQLAIEDAQSVDADAWRTVGEFYDSGIGVKKDSEEAVKWFQKAAEQGDAIAQARLGWCYETGRGVQKNECEGFKWHSKAAAQGGSKEQCHLAWCYEIGMGIPKNEKEALKWYIAASKEKSPAPLYLAGRASKIFDSVNKDVNPSEDYFRILANLPLQSKGASDNYFIGKGCLEIGAFARAKEALALSGNDYAAQAQNIEPEKMGLISLRTSLQDSILEILDDNLQSLGSGVFCGSDGWVLTAAHVVAGQKGLQVRNDRLQAWVVEQVCPGDFEQDLVLLKTSARDQEAVDLAAQPPKVGEEVQMIGHPLGVLSLIVTTGKIESPGSLTNAMISKIPSMPGNSGSPIFNGDNELIGIATRASYFVQARSAGVHPKSWAVSLPNLQRIMREAEKPESFHSVEEIVNWNGKSRNWDSESSKKEKTLSLGQTYLSDSYGDKNSPKAAAIFLREAEKGNAQGLGLLADLHYQGEAVPKDTVKAMELWEQSAKKGNARSMFRLGAEYDRGESVPKDRKVALKWFINSAQMGDESAMANTGVYYLNGWGTDRNLEEGRKWIQASAEKGNAFGQYVYGLIWEGGFGVRPNPALAAKWYEQSAENGSLDGMVKYAQCLEFGSGVRENQANAIAWYQKAVIGTNAEAFFRLGSAYANGRGVVKDFPKALELWKKSAKLGHQDSIRKLNSLGISPQD
jgi:hypothetical protein